MKTVFFFVFALVTFAASAQTDNKPKEDKSKRPSPPAMVKQKLRHGTWVSIDYSQPAIKGRNIGKDLEPLPGKVWRTGANEATVFETNKDVNIEGKDLPAGKYGLFTIMNGDEWTIIFSKNWNQWGAFTYKEGEDVLRVKVKETKAPEFHERMTFTIDKKGWVALYWGDHMINFRVS